MTARGMVVQFERSTPPRRYRRRRRPRRLTKSLAAATVVLAIAAAFAGRRVSCFVRGRHNPARHPLGGFRCVDCGRPGADLEDMGFHDGGYIKRRSTRA